MPAGYLQYILFTYTIKRHFSQPHALVILNIQQDKTELLLHVFVLFKLTCAPRSIHYIIFSHMLFYAHFICCNTAYRVCIVDIKALVKLDAFSATCKDISMIQNKTHTYRSTKRKYVQTI